MMMRFLSTPCKLMAGFVLAIFVSAPAIAQQPSRQNPQAMMDLVMQVQRLQDEVRMLTGKIEDQALELENLRDRQKDQYLDLDQRITDMRNTSPGPVISTAEDTFNSDVTTAGAGAAVKLQHEGIPPEAVPDVREPLDTPSAVTALASPNSQAREMMPSPEAEKAAYDRAFQLLKNLKYADAAGQFQSFLQQYPRSEYADNAQYWLGESHYVSRHYDLALEAFQGLMTRYPDSPKVADGLLKIGYTHYELKQWDQARAALEQVQQQYSGTTLARLAASRLRSMKLEGHY